MLEMYRKYENGFNKISSDATTLK